MNLVYKLGFGLSVILMIIPPFFPGVLLLLFVLGHNYFKNVADIQKESQEKQKSREYPNIEEQLEDPKYKTVQGEMV